MHALISDQILISVTRHRGALVIVEKSRREEKMRLMIQICRESESWTVVYGEDRKIKTCVVESAYKSAEHPSSVLPVA